MQHYPLDENLSRKLVDRLTALFESISYIWSFAKDRDSVIISKDNDFYEMSHFCGCPPKVVKLNCGNQTTHFISNMISENTLLIKSFAESDKCYLDLN